MSAPATVTPHTPDPRRSAQWTALVSVVAAILLVVIKLTAGLVAGSLALIAEAAHSGTDLVAALLTFLALRVAMRPADAEHPYGHGKAEHLAALGEGTFLLLVSGVVGYTAVTRLASDEPHPVEAKVWTFAVLALVVAIDLTRMIALRRGARRHRSPALAASALHFASDLLGTVAVVVGLVLVAAGFPRADAVAALVVAVLVVIAATRLMVTNANVLMDRAPAGAEQLVREAVAGSGTTAVPERVRVRSAAGRHFVEVTIGYEGEAGLGESHAVADRTEAAIAAAMPGSDVIVHVEPRTAADDMRARASAAAQSVRGAREIHNVRVIDVDGRPELSLHVKVPARLPLSDAHALATELERAITDEVPELVDIHTHIEPLSPPVHAGSPDPAYTDTARARIEAVVEALTGTGPLTLVFRVAEDGFVAWLTIALDGAMTVDEAHAAATDVERGCRDAVPELDAVIVHTEPRARS